MSFHSYWIWAFTLLFEGIFVIFVCSDPWNIPFLMRFKLRKRFYLIFQHFIPFCLRSFQLRFLIWQMWTISTNIWLPRFHNLIAFLLITRDDFEKSAFWIHLFIGLVGMIVVARSLLRLVNGIFKHTLLRACRLWYIWDLVVVAYVVQPWCWNLPQFGLQLNFISNSKPFGFLELILVNMSMNSWRHRFLSDIS